MISPGIKGSIQAEMEAIRLEPVLAINHIMPMKYTIRVKITIDNKYMI
jgi:hypothetical protein